MAQLKAWGRRINGQTEQWNVADELVGESEADRRMRMLIVAAAQYEDEVAFHREAMKLAALLMSITRARAEQCTTA